MGLDMFLDGEYYYMTDWEKPENNPTIDGFKKKTETVELGYWRKHPNLHGYIVKTFADGKDKCQRIDLTLENLQDILKAVRDKTLPPTSGFFFGESSSEDDKPTIEILKKAIKWLKEKKENVSKSVYYQASW